MTDMYHDELSTVVIDPYWKLYSLTKRKRHVLMQPCLVFKCLFDQKTEKSTRHSKRCPQ